MSCRRGLSGHPFPPSVCHGEVVIVGHGGVVANVCHGGMASVCHVEVAGLCHGEVASGNYEKKRTLRLVGGTMKYISHSK